MNPRDLYDAGQLSDLAYWSRVLDAHPCSRLLRELLGADTNMRTEIDGDVFVFPCHLASSTAVGDSALALLIDLGWDVHNDDLGVTWISLDRRLPPLWCLPGSGGCH
ncbi:hypothetical protein [Streptomyces sp. NPDC001833]|uniref:hypothetical protein n=1 Tax=Streptomyces sp. NPDC001833 TaxID=3154658 RepID=UPI00331BD98F